MKFFPRVITIGIIATLILFLSRGGIFYGLSFLHKNQSVVSDVPEQTQDMPPLISENEKSHADYGNLVKPEIFVDIIDKDSNYTAGKFVDLGFQRKKNRLQVEFNGYMNNDDEQKVYTFDDIPQMIKYVFRNRIYAQKFGDILQSILGIRELRELKPNDSFRIKNVIFKYQDYIIDNKGYTFMIYDLSTNFKPALNYTRNTDTKEKDSSNKSIFPSTDNTKKNARQKVRSSSDIDLDDLDEYVKPQTKDTLNKKNVFYIKRP